jgi:hypothetical protein
MMRCPNCGQEIPEGKKFCGFCGTRLAPPEPETPPSEPGAPPEDAPAFDEEAPTSLAPEQIEAGELDDESPTTLFEEPEEEYPEPELWKPAYDPQIEPGLELSRQNIYTEITPINKLFIGCGCLILLLFVLCGSVYAVDEFQLWCFGPLEPIWNDFGFICK